MMHTATTDEVRRAWVTHPENPEVGVEAVNPFYRWMDAFAESVLIYERGHGPVPCDECGHRSDCGLHNGPAEFPTACNCATPQMPGFQDVMDALSALTIRGEDKDND